MPTEDDNYVIHGPPPLEPLKNVSLGQLAFDSLLANRNKPPALIDAATGKSITYNEILSQTCALARVLQNQGYGLGTVITISSENNINFFIPIIAALYIGATTAPINHNYTEEETLHCLNITRPKIIFCSRASCEKFLKLKTQIPFEEIIIIDDDQGFQEAKALSVFIKGYSSENFQLVPVDPQKDVAFIMCSSGTTGLPKGVMQTHSNLMVRYMHSIDPRYVFLTNTFLGILPFFHGYGLTTNFFALILGQQIIVIRRFEEHLFLRTIQNYKIECLMLAPPLMVLLAKSEAVEKYDLSCVKEIGSGAAPLGKHIEISLKKRLNISNIRQGYGLTEATLAVILLQVGETVEGSSGKVVSYMKCKIRDPETGKSLAAHQVGEICVKGPLVMPGYYRNEEATKQSFTSDGWLLTGDLGYYNQDGYFFIVDRLKEVIKCKGYQVAPAELEALLLNHPKIKDCGVVGLPDEEAGELPLAFVVKNDGVLVSEEEIVDYVSRQVSPHKRLKGGVVFLNAIPKNPSGKILRKDLRQLVQKLKCKL